ncbi:MAG: hypothetical protein ABSB41_07470 [Anaerolineales bacterium]|jgi:hypothetical protein
MEKEWITISGVVVEGYRVASGPSEYYPYGALEKQKPLFKEHGLDLDPFFNGTLNISIKPYRYQVVQPRYTFRKIEWTNLHPPEDFSFSACRVRFNQIFYPGWVYYPHPETKKRNYQDPTLVEVIAMRIPRIHYRDSVEIGLNPQEIKVLLAP